MAVTYSNSGKLVKDDRLKVVLSYIAGNTAPTITTSGTAGKLVIGTSSLNGSASDATAAIVTITLGTTPGTISSGVITLSGLPLSGTASLAGTNTAAKAEIRDNSNNVIISGLTVGTSATDIIISSTSITSGQTVTVTAATITHG